MLDRLLPIIKKEFRHIRRDKRVLAVLTLVPAGLLLLNGYALNFDVNHIRMVVVNLDKGSISREFVNSFVTSGYFDYVQDLATSEEATHMLDDGHARMVLVVPAGFSDRMHANESASVQILVDGMDANSATTIVGFSQAVVLQYSQRIVLNNLAKIGRGNYIPIQYEGRIWYNPELKSSKFLVPGLIAFILAITAVIATSLSIVREKERNTIEQINVSPVHSLHFIMGKLIPYALISLVAAALVLIAAYALFGVVIKGSVFLLFGATVLFVIAALSIGLLVSTISDSQQVAFQIAALVSMLPTIILSGFVFPIRSMPWWLQVLSNVTPAKFYLVILRSILLKGAGIAAFWEQLVYLAVFATVLLTISTVRFKRTIG
ncbi:MAG: ABC transporter permease [Ignavibacteriales bacterium]|nr:ABC transporter permease [Ignavibacteriales bacterium]